MAKILIVEDDRALAALLEKKLSFERHICDVVHDGIDAREFLKRGPYDILLLDWELPGGVSGPDIAAGYRATGGQASIIFLTGKKSIGDKETGFTAGADDYLTKPFHMKELTLRIDAQLARANRHVKNTLSIGSLVLDKQAHTVSRNGIPVQLSMKEFLLLEFFMRNPDHVFTVDSILAGIWSSDAEVTPGAVRTLLKQLRKKIGDDGQDSVIHNIHGLGYKFVSSDA